MKISQIKIDNPEVQAMVEAMYSRSNKPFAERLAEVNESTADEFMATYYVGYGHESIGDCAPISLAVEEIDMFSSVLIQHSGWYRGQEQSTRYIDFSNHGYVNPFDPDTEHEKYIEFGAIRNLWVSLYTLVFNRLYEETMKSEPSADELGITERERENAIKAYCYDVARGFIPICTHTSLSWNGDVRHIMEQITLMRNLDIDFVTKVAYGIYDKLKEVVPSSVPDGWKREPTELEVELARDAIRGTTSIDQYEWLERDFESTNYVSLMGPSALPDDVAEMMHKRITRTPVPYYSLRRAGRLEDVVFSIDYAGLRDLHRHRSIQWGMMTNIPVTVEELKQKITRPIAMHTYYTSRLTEEEEQMFHSICNSITKAMRSDNFNVEDMRRFMLLAPMGNTCVMSADIELSALIYLMELRSTPAVHPTVRQVIAGMYGELSECEDNCSDWYDGSKPLTGEGHGIHIHPEIDHIGPYYPRGSQTIERRDEK